MNEQEWLNGQGKNPHQRLDALGQLWGEHMEWAAGIDAKLVELQKSGAPSTDEADAIVTDMMHSQNRLAGFPAKIHALQVEIIGLKDVVLGYKEVIEVAQAEAVMKSEGKNAEQRKASVAIALSENEAYQATLLDMRQAEKARLIKEAELSQIEEEKRLIYNNIRNLRARLEALTAKANLYLGESVR
jgi:hypothetical protein